MGEFDPTQLKANRIAGIRGIVLFLLPVLLAPLPASPAFGASSVPVAGISASDAVARQEEISDDIGKLQKTVMGELAAIDLEDETVARRQVQIAVLRQRDSTDTEAWGYTENQKGQYRLALRELSAAYAAYAVMRLQAGERLHVTEPADLSELPAFRTGTVDINAADALREEIWEESRTLNFLLFSLQSKIGKLRLDLADVARLKQEAREAGAGGKPLELPRVHELNLELERVNVALSWAQLMVQKELVDRNVAAIQKMQRRLGEVIQDVSFPGELLEAKLEILQSRAARLNEEIQQAQKSLNAANAALGRARLNLVPDDPASTTRLQAAQANMIYWELMLSLLDDEIAFQREARQIWQRRYQVFHGMANGGEIWQYRNEAQQRMEELHAQLDGIRTMESETLQRLELLHARLENAPQEVRQNLMEALQSSRMILPDVMNRYASLIPRQMFLEQRLYDEATEGIDALRLAEKVHSVSQETITAFLNTELWEGKDYSVTVRKLIVAAAVFLSSFFLSSWGSRWIRNRMIRHFHTNATAAEATQRIVFYVLWITFLLIALNIVKIPLTAFAFLGGALALGIGFGMQNIFNNVISGFIIIFSRPFKVDDIVSVAETEGRVLDIGSRSTTIRTWDNLDVILPNRYFLENSVTNWTNWDQKRREVLTARVAYGTDARRVEKLLLQAARESPGVLEDPAPFVRLQNFGENALEFLLYFWVDLSLSDRSEVASGIRFHLLSLFQEAGIDIPFPQHDVHFKTPQIGLKIIETSNC